MFMCELCNFCTYMNLSRFVWWVSLCVYVHYNFLFHFILLNCQVIKFRHKICSCKNSVKSAMFYTKFAISKYCTIKISTLAKIIETNLCVCVSVCVGVDVWVSKRVELASVIHIFIYDTHGAIVHRWSIHGRQTEHLNSIVFLL